MMLTEPRCGPEVRACWGAIGISLGDVSRNVVDMDDAREKFAARRLPMNPALLGFNVFHESSMDSVDQMADAIGRSLARACVQPGDVEMLVIASAETGFLAGGAVVPQVLRRSGLVAALPFTVTSQECASLLTALDIARRHVEDGTYRTVVVVSHDRAPPGSRIKSFGVVSDACLACVVSATPGPALTLGFLGYSIRADLAGMTESDDFDGRKRLADAVLQPLFRAVDMSVGEVGKAFSTNFFSPLARFNTVSAGLVASQCDTGRGAEVGHCLGADPLINLDHYMGGDVPDGRHLLMSYAPGFLAAMLITHEVGRVDTKKSGQIIQSW